MILRPEQFNAAMANAALVPSNTASSLSSSASTDSTSSPSVSSSTCSEPSCAGLFESSTVVAAALGTGLPLAIALAAALLMLWKARRSRTQLISGNHTAVGFESFKNEQPVRDMTDQGQFRHELLGQPRIELGSDLIR